MTKNVFLAGAAIAVLATSTAIGVTPHAAALHRNGTATAAQARAFVAKA